MKYLLVLTAVVLSFQIFFVQGFNLGGQHVGVLADRRSCTISVPQRSATVSQTSFAALGTLPTSLNKNDETYCFCSRCKSAFFMDEAKLGRTGSRVMCSVCTRDWFQTTSSLLKAGNAALVLSMPPEQVEQAKRNAAGNFARYIHKTKATVFVGNLPTSYTEKDIEEIFAEYGILSTQLIRDKTDGTSKGFAFLEVSELL